MPLILFWLVPVILVVVLIMVLTHDQEVRTQPKLLIFDPIAVIDKWLIARVLGKEGRVLNYLWQVRQVLPGTGNFVEDWLQKLDLPEAVPAEALALQLNKRVGSDGELYQFEQDGRIISVLIGDMSTILPYCDQGWEGTLDAKSLPGLLQEEQLTREHGYLGMAVAARVDRKLPNSQARYQLLGYVLCEAELNERKISKLRQLEGGKKARVLTLLSPLLAQNLATKILPTLRWSTISAVDLREVAPKQRRAAFDKANLIADTNLNDRHEICLQWRHAYQLELVASHPEDTEHLPCKIVKI